MLRSVVNVRRAVAAAAAVSASSSCSPSSLPSASLAAAALYARSLHAALPKSVAAPVRAYSEADRFKKEFEKAIKEIQESEKDFKFDPEPAETPKETLIQEHESVVGQASQHEFKAETKKLLQIVAKSLYSEQEVFIRELISNAADALEKLRFLRLTGGQKLVQEENPPEIRIAVDEANKTITIQDFGIGMTEAELNDNLGTIARSGSKAFLEKLDDKSDAKDKIIGQFGVGFYSAFMVADKIRVYSRSHVEGSKGYLWTTDLSGTYSIAEAEGVAMGTKIVIHLKEDAVRFASKKAIQTIIKKYSNFVSFPIALNGSIVNTILPLWAVSDKKSITDEQHNEFFRFISSEFGNPFFRLHFSTDSPLSLRSILYIPEDHFERFGNSRMDPGVHLYSRKVLIQSKAKNLLPTWLRFVRGVVDCEDISLNVSRELLQESGSHLSRLQDVLTARIIKWLRDESKNNEDKYIDFYKKFNRFIREGVCTDDKYRDEIAKLLMYPSSTTGKMTSLKAYVERMKPDQEEIYFFISDSQSAAESSPYLEPFKERGYEVLIADPTFDVYVFNAIEEFQGKPVVNVAGTPKFLQKKEAASTSAEQEDLISFIKTTLGSRVDSIKISNRIKSSPAIIVDSNTQNHKMLRMMRLIDPDARAAMPTIAMPLEINPDHAVIAGINDLRKAAKREAEADAAAAPADIAKTPSGMMAEVLVRQVFDNALLQAGLLENPGDIVARLNIIMEAAVRATSK